MGLLHNFRGLQEFSTKLSKFKQAVLIDALVRNEAVPESMYRFKNDGACASYCVIWLYLKFNSNRLNQLPRNQGANMNSTIYKIANIGVNLQSAYTANWDSNEWHRNTINFFNGFDLDFTLNPKRAETFLELLGKAASVLLHRPGVYISLDQNGRGDHAIAMFKDSDYYYFFDPDVGEYQITAENIKKFLKSYITLRENAFRVRVTGGYYAAIRKK